MKHGPAWLRKLTSPHIEDSVLFVDTATGAPQEQDSSGHLVNPLQVKLIISLLEAFRDVRRRVFFA